MTETVRKAICLLLREGMPAKQIAYELDISVWVVYKAKERCPKMSNNGRGVK